MESKKLFFYELEGRGYIFQNKKWDETKHGFEDDMLNMAWEMWSSGQAAKAQAVPDTYTPIVLALEDVQSKIAKTSFLTMDEENENEVMAVNANELAAYIDELIEAQEQVG